MASRALALEAPWDVPEEETWVVWFPAAKAWRERTSKSAHKMIALGSHLTIVEGKPSHSANQSYYDETDCNDQIARNNNMMRIGRFFFLLFFFRFI